MIKIPFVKMHGLGNDFIIIEEDSIREIVNKKELIEEMCMRHTSVGCDQLIMYSPVGDKFAVKIYNSDGSTGQACGNVSRCLTRLLHETRGVDKNFNLIVADRVVKCEYISQNKLKVNMGQAKFDAEWMPINEKLWSIAKKYNIDQKEIVCVDIGNPHVVIFSKFSKSDQAVIGSDMQKSEMFNDGVNVNFAEITRDKILLSVFERGVGFTMACGSGACASFAGARILGFIEQDNIDVEFKLGKLHMSKNSDNEIIMTGPAEYVCEGEYYSSCN